MITFGLMISGMLIVTPTTDVTAEDDTSFSIKAVNGTVSFDGPVNKVVSMGTAFTSTIIALGGLESILFIDTSSKSSGLEGLENFNEANENVYPTSAGAIIKQKLLAGVGGFEIDTDVVILYSYSTSLLSALAESGIKVLAYYPKTYDEGTSLVTDMGKLLGLESKATEIVGEMNAKKTYYEETLHENGITEDSQKVNAIYASYSSNVLKIGNVDSTSVILFKIAGGINPADDATMSGSSLTTYEPQSGMLLALKGQGKLDVIFLDPYYTGTIAEFRNAMNLPEDVKIVHLTILMNTYGPESMKGLEYMASVMYPDIFGDSEPQDEGDKPDNTMLYVGAAIGVIVLLGAVIFIMRR